MWVGLLKKVMSVNKPIKDKYELARIGMSGQWVKCGIGTRVPAKNEEVIAAAKGKHESIFRRYDFKVVVKVKPTLWFEEV